MNAMDDKDIVTVMLPEQVDSVTSAAVETQMLAAMRPGGKVVVDGSAVTYMSAAGVRVLATAIHRAEEQQTHIVLCSFSGPAADCLLVSGFSQLFDVAGTVEEARKRLRANPADGAVERLHSRGSAG
jgi:anti-anti-sigma factor